MFELILYDLSLSWKLLLTYLLTLFIIGCIWFVSIRKFNLKDGKIKMYGLLLGINNMGAFILSIHIVRSFLIMYYSIFTSANLQLSIALVGIASVIYIVFDMKNILFEVVNTLSLMAIIYFINSLNTYIIEVEASASVYIIKFALGIFSIMYMTYYLLRNFESITTNNENIMIDEI